MSKGEFQYHGEELDDFFSQKNWGSYVLNKIKDSLKGHCVEIGAGMGYFSLPISNLNNVQKLELYEPDQKNFQFLKNLLGSNSKVEIHHSFYGENGKGSIDSFIMMDVLEHIEDDRGMLKTLRDNLSENGCIVLLLPAHMFLYSEFDKSIGHYRRYDRNMITKALPEGLRIEKCLYLDSVGMAASFFARASGQQPKKWQLWIWDKIMVSLSRILDPLFFYKIGKSMVVILKKP